MGVGDRPEYLKKNQRPNKAAGAGMASADGGAPMAAGALAPIAAPS